MIYFCDVTSIAPYDLVRAPLACINVVSVARQTYTAICGHVVVHTTKAIVKKKRFFKNYM